MKVYLLLPLFFILFSCEDEDLTQNQLKQKMETISDSIEDLVSLTCDNADQCKAAAIGSKPCGGPTHYIVYSSATDEEKLLLLIKEYTDANEQYNEMNGIGSDCAVVSPPTLDCVSGNCEVVGE